MRVDWRRIVWIELAILGGCAVTYVGWLILQRVLHTALVLLIAGVVAFAISPLVERLEKRVEKRGYAVAIVYIGLLIVIIGGGFLLAQPFVSQTSALLQDLPRYADAASKQIPQLNDQLHTLGVPVTVDQLQGRLSAFILDGGSTVVGGTLVVIGVLTGTIVDLVLVIVLSLYLVIDTPRIRGSLKEIVPSDRRPTAIFVEETVTRVAGGYLRGQIIMAVTIGLLAGVGAVIFNLRYPVVIAVFAAIMELIPMFGPILGALPALLLALLNPFPTVIWIALYFIGIQQIESNVLGPRITGHAVGLHPLAALLALLVGFDLAGLLGAVFAVPVIGILWVLLGAIYRRVRFGKEEPVPRELGWRLPSLRHPARPRPIVSPPIESGKR